MIIGKLTYVFLLIMAEDTLAFSSLLILMYMYLKINIDLVFPSTEDTTASTRLDFNKPVHKVLVVFTPHSVCQKKKNERLYCRGVCEKLVLFGLMMRSNLSYTYK